MIAPTSADRHPSNVSNVMKRAWVAVHANPIRHGVKQQGSDKRVQQITHNLFKRMIA